MGLIARLWKAGTALLLCSTSVYAVPKLRLTNTVVGPVTVAQGQAGPQQELEVFNAGDGNLNLQFTATATWVQASVGATRPCQTRDGQCTPVRLALNTQSLAAGLHTATVNVHAPDAIDAPQQILVSVQVGTRIPDRVDFVVAPGGTDDVELSVNRCTGSLFGPLCMSFRPSTLSGGNWLSVALDGLGSFRFSVPFRIVAAAPTELSEGTYQGSVAVTDSQFAADNKAVAVTMRVTSQAIARANPRTMRFRAAVSSRRQTQNLVIVNAGRASLSITGATATTASGGNWLAAERIAGFDVVAVSVDVTGMNAGVFTGSVAVASNAANGTVNVPVVLEVVAHGPPVTFYQGVANNATFLGDEPLARGVIAAAFGEQFTTGEPVAASALPLPTTLGDIRAFLNDVAVPLYFGSYGQANFQVPYDARLGEGTFRIDRGSTRGNSVSVNVVASLPRLLKLRGDYGIVVNSDGTFPLPPSLGIPNSRPARPGDTLVIYALGLGQTDPPVASGVGAPSSPLARVPEGPGGARVFFGALALPTGVPVAPLFVGLTPAFVGLYQINVTVPPEVGAGDVPVRLQLATIASDFVLIHVQR